MFEELADLMEVKKAEILAEVKMMMINMENVESWTSRLEVAHRAPRLQVLDKTVDNKIESLYVHLTLFRFGGKRSQRGRCWKLRGEISRSYNLLVVLKNQCTPPKCNNGIMTGGENGCCNVSEGSSRETASILMENLSISSSSLSLWLWRHPGRSGKGGCRDGGESGGGGKVDGAKREFLHRVSGENSNIKFLVTFL